MLFGDGPLASLFVRLFDLLIGPCGCSLPVMTAALGKGCSIHAISSALATFRVVGGCNSFMAGWRAWWYTLAVLELLVLAVPGRVGKFTVDDEGAPQSSSSGLWYTMRCRCMYETSTVLCALLLVVLCVALGFRSLLLSILSTLSRSLDLVRFMSPAFCFLLGGIGPESISTAQLGFMEPGGACDG